LCPASTDLAGLCTSKDNILFLQSA
jgi:hypothetical protein